MFMGDVILPGMVKRHFYRPDAAGSDGEHRPLQLFIRHLSEYRYQFIRLHKLPPADAVTIQNHQMQL